MTNYLTQIFETGSTELADYLTKNQTGTKMAAPGGKLWTIAKVETVDDFPSPVTGAACTRVILTLNQ